MGGARAGGKARGQAKKENILKRIDEILNDVDYLVPYILVSGGAAAALYYPEALKPIQALIIAYFLARNAFKDLIRTSPRKARIAREAAEATERALEKMGVPREELERLAQEAEKT